MARSMCPTTRGAGFIESSIVRNAPTAVPPLDIREEASHLPPDIREEGRGPRRHQRTGPARHARPADSQDLVAVPHARLGAHASHSATLARCAPGRTRLDLPGARAARAA